MEHKNFVPFLKAIACLLITNSHCGAYYPISFLAIGGGFGNALFFAISGYCLASIKLPFTQWMRRRISRILPATVFFIVFGALLVDFPQGIQFVDVSDCVLHYINRYWFVFAIIIYYPVYYSIFSRHSGRGAIIALFVHFAGYLVLYFSLLDLTVLSVELEGFSPFKVYYYFSCMLIGGILRNPPDALRALQGRTMLCVTGLCLSVVVWGCEYGAMLVFDRCYIVQFFVELGTFFFALFAVLICSAFDDKLAFDGFIEKAIGLVGNSTLMVYLVQVTFISYIAPGLFPIDIFLFYTMAIGGGVVAYLVQNRIQGWAKNRNHPI